MAEHWDGFSLTEMLENLETEITSLTDDERRQLNRKIYSLQRLIRTKISEVASRDSTIKDLFSGAKPKKEKVSGEVASFITGMVGSALFSENRILALAALTLSEVARMEGVAHFVEKGISMKLTDGSSDVEAEKLWLGDCPCPSCAEKREKIERGESFMTDFQSKSHSSLNDEIRAALDDEEAEISFVNVNPETGETENITGERAKLYARRVIEGKNPFTGEDMKVGEGAVIQKSTQSTPSLIELLEKLQEQFGPIENAKPPTPTKH